MTPARDPRWSPLYCGWCARLHVPGPEHCLYGVVLVTGGRDYRDGHAVAVALDLVALRVEVAAIRHGGAMGADRLAAIWATRRGVTADPMPADWTRYGKRAAPLRNAAMLAKDPPPVLVVAFPGGNGTADMLARVRAADVPVWVVGASPPGVMADVVEAHDEITGRALNDAETGARVAALLRDVTRPHTDPEVVAAVRAAEVAALRILQRMREVEQ